jgi:hypothetical protein
VGVPVVTMVVSMITEVEASHCQIHPYQSCRKCETELRLTRTSRLNGSGCSLGSADAGVARKMSEVVTSEDISHATDGDYIESM